MSNVIEVASVSKSFAMCNSPFDLLKKNLFKRGDFEYFHALKNVSFCAKQGETVGIVGHNGSGKSTLLQIIAGTMTPSSGHATVNGRVAALLELGSGFNPEFTGHENIFFNATLIGLSKKEIEQRYDDIVAFSGIEPFIHRPVKTYSSGMLLRLAFSVIINTEPDVLIVDEALAVGDDAFQRKCHARLMQLQARGATLLFVSHSAGQVIDLCDSAILLDRGEVLMQGTPKQVVHNYHKLLHMTDESDRDAFRQKILLGDFSSEYKKNETKVTPDKGQFDDSLQPVSTVWYQPNGAIISSPMILNEAENQVNLLESRGKYQYCFSVTFQEEAFEVGFGMLIKMVNGTEIAGATTIRNHEKRLSYVGKGQVVKVKFDFDCNLKNGTYFLNCGCSALKNGERVFLHRGVDAAMFTVIEDNPDATGVVDLDINLNTEVVA
ncbi:ABC transporter ATP-binding protein [Photobacterium leiognathi]|uniref:ABC transporter ATP-binding protein n=1 Tax=Photobacterium leiognathi TaxID=553611 RepID=UPI0029828A7A|nr:ABC transporter ATP-binding protein [Photobacterium leiognathi]